MLPCCLFICNAPRYFLSSGHVKVPSPSFLSFSSISHRYLFKEIHMFKIPYFWSRIFILNNQLVSIILKLNIYFKKIKIDISFYTGVWQCIVVLQFTKIAISIDAFLNSISVFSLFGHIMSYTFPSYKIKKLSSIWLEMNMNILLHIFNYLIQI